MNTTTTSGSDCNDADSAATEGDPIVDPSINHFPSDSDEENAVANLEHGDVALPPDSQGRSVFSV